MAQERTQMQEQIAVQRELVEQSTAQREEERAAMPAERCKANKERQH